MSGLEKASTVPNYKAHLIFPQLSLWGMRLIIADGDEINDVY